MSTIPESLRSRLVAEYLFIGNANDSSGNGNDGTVNGATLTTDNLGKNDRSYEFTGSDKITITTGVNPRSENFTYNIWVTPDIVTGTHSLYAKEAAGDNPLIYFNTESSKLKCLFEGSGDQIPTYLSTETLVINTLYMLTVTVDRTNSLMKYYINGVLDSTHDFSATSVSSIAPTQNMYLEITYDESSSGYDGTYHEFKQWNRECSLSEINQLFVRGIGTGL